MRYLHVIFLLLMLVFAAVQYNDPDGLMWVAIYSIPALWSAVAAFWRSWFSHLSARLALLASIAASLIGVVYFWPLTPRFWTKDVWFEVETAREGMGLMIVALVLLVTWYSGHRQRRILPVAPACPQQAN
ncbi:MAG: transmembrane 220 family protein [Granulosicoccus sp.]